MNDINFLPQSYRRQRARRRRTIWQGCIIALTVLAGIAFATSQRVQTGILRHQVVGLEGEAAAVRRAQTESARLLTEHKALMHQTRLQRELAQPVTQTQILAVLARVLPDRVSLVRIDVVAQRPEPAPIPAPTQSGAKSKPDKNKQAVRAAHVLDFTLQGIAPNDLTVANLVGLLTDHPLFSNVRLRYSRAADVEGVAMREFELIMRVDLDRDIQARKEEVALAD